MITKKFDPSNLILPATFTSDPEKLERMKNSIKQKELLHPPCVKESGEVFAGEIHVKACIELKVTEIECHVYPNDLSDEEYKEINLHKNLQYQHLSWDDQVTFEKNLHELRVSQNGKGKGGKKIGWSLRDTAEELNMSFGVLSEDIRMADAISFDPSLRRIKNKSTAMQVIMSQIKRSNQEMSAFSPVLADTNVCLHGGSEVILKAYPDNIFDLCLTDPPWLEYKDKNMVRDEFTLPVFKEIFRVLKRDSFLYAFVSTQDWIYYFSKLTEIGFSVQKYPLIWIKEGVLSYGTRSWEHQRDYELIILAVKGSPALVDNMISSIMSCKVVHSSKLIHPNEKPPDVIKKILNYCTYERSLVLDPFAGSGVVLEACKQMKRRYVGIEKDTTFFEKIQERLKK